MFRTLLLALLMATPSLTGVRTDFVRPPQTYGTDCWWWWLNGNVDEAAISRDLKAMADKGFYGAVVIDAGGADQRGHAQVPQGPLFGSAEWCRLFRYALDEAARYGLVLGANIQSGWNLGGPCVTPQYAAKHLVSSVLQTSGAPVAFPQPEARHGFYRDIAVFAFPRTGETSLRIHDLGSQISDKEMGFSTPDGTLLLSNPDKGQGQTDLVRVGDVLDLTALLQSDGRLAWTPLPGEWTVVRIGYTCTSAGISTCSSSWGGLVLDHLSAAAFDHYWDQTVEPILAACGPHVGTTLRYLSTDSWEAGGMNWTDDFEAFFRQVNGYSLRPWLLAAAGFVVEDQEQTLGYLADFRRAVAEAIATRHFGRFAERARAHGIGIQPESAGPHGAPFDGIRNYGLSEVVMSEFWAMSPHRPTPGRRFFLKQASSAAHVYGKEIIGAEAFTTIGPQWNDCLWSNHKPAFDHEVCEGLNRVYFHTFTCSPPSMGRPGQEYFAGTHFNPQITWWDQAGAYVQYLARNQVVAQQGEAVCEVLYYYGDHVPNIYPLSPPVAPGYDYDAVDAFSLLRAKVRGGQIVLPSGRTYRLLVLPPSRVLSPAVLRKVQQLVRRGATVVGDKPLRAVTLQSRADFSRRADALWGAMEPYAPGRAWHVRHYGRGHVVSGPPAEYLASVGLAPDCEAGPLRWIHYRFADGDAYFLSNQAGESVSLDARFRVGGPSCGKGGSRADGRSRDKTLSVEFWDAVTGRILPASGTGENGRTTVRVALGPFESRWVVFARDAAGLVGPDVSDSSPKAVSADSSVSPAAAAQTECVLGGWKVFFDPALGGPGLVDFPQLTDWTDHSDPRIRYYSGPAVYQTSFRTRAVSARLSLGTVLDVGIATVSLNGRDLGVVWTWPFEVRLDEALQEGDNHLEITVINSWYNRLAGDRLHPADAWGARTNIRIGHPEQLSPSGLLGPVKVLVP